jgi:hypothetical protein
LKKAKESFDRTHQAVLLMIDKDIEKIHTNI